jgi:iron-sulfur cluster repair protein YtfE (RIC family)
MSRVADTSSIASRRDAMLAEWEALAARAPTPTEKLEIYKRGTRLVYGLYEDLITHLRDENTILKQRLAAAKARR